MGFVVGASIGLLLAILILRYRKRVFTWAAIIATGVFVLGECQGCCRTVSVS